MYRLMKISDIYKGTRKQSKFFPEHQNEHQDNGIVLNTQEMSAHHDSYQPEITNLYVPAVL